MPNMPNMPARFLRSKSDASVKQELREQSTRLLDDSPQPQNECEMDQATPQADLVPTPRWQAYLVQALIAMGQTPNPFLLSTASSY